MGKQIRAFISITAVITLAFMFMACGGSSSGGDDIVYEGSTDPAVADSTTAPTLAEYGIGSVEAGFPLVAPFAAQPPEMMPASLAAQPMFAMHITTVTIALPPEASYYGSDYDSEYGTGIAELGGMLTLSLGNPEQMLSAMVCAWTGSIAVASTPRSHASTSGAEPAA